MGGTAKLGAQTVTECDDQMAGGGDVEIGIDDTELLAARQRAANGLMGEGGVALQRGLHVRIAGRFGQHVGGQTFDGTAQLLADEHGAEFLQRRERVGCLFQRLEHQGVPLALYDTDYDDHFAYSPDYNPDYDDFGSGSSSSGSSSSSGGSSSSS